MVLPTFLVQVATICFDNLRVAELVQTISNYLTTFDHLCLRRIGLQLPSGRILSHESICRRGQYFLSRTEQAPMLKVFKHLKPDVITFCFEPKYKRSDDYVVHAHELMGIERFICLVDIETKEVIKKDMQWFGVQGHPGQEGSGHEAGGHDHSVAPRVLRLYIKVKENLESGAFANSVLNGLNGRPFVQETIHSQYAECRQCQKMWVKEKRSHTRTFEC